MSCALVTGATGLVGSHIVERLLSEGWEVRAFVRPSSASLDTPGVRAAHGDILDADAFSRAAVGCSVIFHCAAVIAANGGWEAFSRPNIDGTRNAIAAAERAGARLLQLSSVAVYNARFRDGLEKTHEDTPLGPLPERAYYARSKRESEALVMAAHASGRIWATAVRPDVIYGRRDRLFVPKIAGILRTGFAPLIGGGGTTLPVVHAANVAEGAVRAAMHDGAGGRAYNLANDFDVTARDFFRLGGEGLGRRVRFVPIPFGLANAVFRAGLRALTLLSGGLANVVSRDALALVTRDNPYTSERARRELGWSPGVSPEDGVPDAFRWWLEHRRQRR